MNKLKILMVDPWKNHYISGLVEELSINNEVTLYTNYHFDVLVKNSKIIKKFFKYSEQIKKNVFRKIIRGLEYVLTYISLVKHIKKSDYTVIHFQWLLYYKIDLYFLKKIRKTKRKLVLTAHNVTPHTNQGKHITNLRKIYSIFDTILVHGEAIKQEFGLLFPEYISKVRIQFHGIYKNQSSSYDINLVNPNLHGLIKSVNKVFIMFGNIFYNKGFDRVIEIWKSKNIVHDSTLIIAGKIVQPYTELESQMHYILNDKSIVYIPSYIEENTLRFLIDASDCILLPYRHASMSGVIFTAAAMKKTVLATKTGAIAEYLDSKNSFIIENSDLDLLNTLERINAQIDKSILKSMGTDLSEYINLNYSWEKICLNLIKYYKE